MLLGVVVRGEGYAVCQGCSVVAMARVLLGVWKVRGGRCVWEER